MVAQEAANNMPVWGITDAVARRDERIFTHTLSLFFMMVQRGSRTGETAIQGGSWSTDAQTIV